MEMFLSFRKSSFLPLRKRMSALSGLQRSRQLLDHRRAVGKNAPPHSCSTRSHLKEECRNRPQSQQTYVTGPSNQSPGKQLSLFLPSRWRRSAVLSGSVWSFIQTTCRFGLALKQLYLEENKPHLKEKVAALSTELYVEVQYQKPPFS